MGYAVSFLLFYSLDILIFHQFLIFGMIPMNFLKAAVTAYAVYMLWKSRNVISIKPLSRIIRIWMVVYGIYIIHYLSGPAMRFVKPNSWMNEILMTLNLSDIDDLILIGITILCVLLTRFPKGCPWGQWLGLSGIALVIGSSTTIIIDTLCGGVPTLIYQYLGVLDLPPLFCILMVVQSLIRVRYEFS